jgi:hypothetical protein
MTDGNSKFVRIVSVVYLTTLVVAVSYALVTGIFTGDSIVKVAGNVMMYGGVVVFVLGFMILGSNRGLHRRETQGQYVARRNRERPVELVAWAIITAGLLISISGYLAVYFVTPRA